MAPMLRTGCSRFDDVGKKIDETSSRAFRSWPAALRAAWKRRRRQTQGSFTAARRSRLFPRSAATELGDLARQGPRALSTRRPRYRTHRISGDTAGDRGDDLRRYRRRQRVDVGSDTVDRREKRT